MGNRDNLQDIILDSQDDSGKFRKIVTIIISLVILFLIVVIIVKFINSNNKDEQQLVVNNTTEELILPEEPILQDIDSKIEVFEQVPILEDVDLNLQTLEQDFKPKTQIQEPTEQAIKTQNPIKPATEPLTIKTKPTQPVQKPNAKDNTKDNKQVSIEQVFNSISTPSSSTKLAKGNYIQVASVNVVDANSNFIKKITNAGYDYKIYKTMVNGKNTTKILIGPFEGNNLTKNMEKIRANIAANAFVYRIK